MAFVSTFIHNQNDYWELNHKVNFDPNSKLIIVHGSTTEIDVKVNLYSDMKEWMLLPLRQNNKYKPPIRTIGGDNTVAGQKAGDIYFMQNGWRVQYDPTKVKVTGVLFSDDFDTPWVDYDGNPIYPAQVSSLVTGIAVDTPSAAENATAVRTELSPELGNMDTTVSSRASQASLDALQGDVDTVLVTVGNMSLVIDDLLKYQGNKTLIDPNNFTLTIYEDNGTDVLKVFDLQDANGVASITDIYRRIPR